MNKIEYFNHLIKLIDTNPPPSIHNLYIISDWVPAAQQCIQEGSLPPDTNIIIIPNSIDKMQEEYMKEASAMSWRKILEMIPYEKEE